MDNNRKLYAFFPEFIYTRDKLRSIKNKKYRPSVNYETICGRNWRQNTLNEPAGRFSISVVWPSCLNLSARPLINNNTQHCSPSFQARFSRVSGTHSKLGPNSAGLVRVHLCRNKEAQFTIAMSTLR